MMLEISRSLLDGIEAQAAASPDAEICGLLLGEGTVVTALLPAANVADDPATRFEIHPATLLAAHRAARSGAPAIIGCYHSHPSGSALPSPRDAADAGPDGQFWLIAGSTGVSAWRAVAAGVRHGRFDPVALHARQAAPRPGCAGDSAPSEGQTIIRGR